MPAFHTARKNSAGEWLVNHLLIDPALARAFGGIYVHVHPAALRLRATRCRVERARLGTRYSVFGTPVIFCATHSGWFDGYVASLLNRRIFHHDGYLMMEEASLRRYPFFTWAGTFGIDRDHTRAALASIEYIAGVLSGSDEGRRTKAQGSFRPSSGSRRSLWMFPQGIVSHPDVRPLKLYGGVAHIVRRVGDCVLVPVALRYDFLMEQAPDAFAWVGPPLELAGTQYPLRELTAKLTASMTELADRLQADVTSYDLRSYRRIFSGRGSVNRAWDRVLRMAERARKWV